MPHDRAPSLIPSSLLDLAVLAIQKGAWDVSIGYGSGTGSLRPLNIMIGIAWGADDYTSIVYHYGDDLESVVGAHLPGVLRRDDAVVIDGQLEIFKTAASNGWSVDYIRKVLDHRNEVRRAESNDRKVILGLVHSLQIRADNWAWKPKDKNRGGPKSIIYLYSAREGSDGPPRAVGVLAETGRAGLIDSDLVVKAISETAPYYLSPRGWKKEELNV